MKGLLKELLKSLGRAIPVTILVGWISVFIHEGAHWTMNKILGGIGVIYWYHWGLWAEFHGSRAASPLVGFAGGIGAALVLLPLVIFSFKKKWRWEYRLAIGVVVIVQFLYGIAEPFIYP